MAMSPDHTHVNTTNTFPLMEEENRPSPVMNSDLMDQSADSTIGKRTDGIGDMEQASVPLTVDYLDIETGPEITYGPLNKPERSTSNSPILMHGPPNQPSGGAELGDVFYGPMNNAGGEDFTSERISKDIKGMKYLHGIEKYNCT